MKTLRALLPLLALAAIPALAQPSITTSSFPNGVLNEDYSAPVNCNSCQGYTFGLVSGSGNLPPGLGLSSTSGNGSATVSGIPSATGTYTFTLGLYLPTSGTPQVERTFAITIPSGLTVLTTTFPNGTVGAAYSQAISASGSHGTVRKRG